MPRFLSLVSSLRELFVFLTGSGVFALELQALLVDDASERWLRIYLPVTVPGVVRLEPRYFTTMHETVRAHAPQIVAQWFAKRDQLETATRGYSEVLCAEGTMEQTVLLRTLQLLEHLHGVLWPSETKYVAKATMKRLVGWLRAKFPTDIEAVEAAEMALLQGRKEILLSRIGGLNELSFRSRIERMFREIPGGVLMPLLDNPRDLDETLKELLPRLEATRHFLTHFSEEQRALAYPKEEMEKITGCCWGVLTYWLARALGLEQSVSEDMALKSGRYAMFLVKGYTTL